jgi:hypothetical protein
MNCGYCDNQAEWVENKEIYGRNYGKSYMIWLCKPCDAYVGCHNNTKKPKGQMANKELRKARILVHNFIDPLWREHGMNRKKMYKTLSDAMGYEVHVGETKDVSECNELLKTAKAIFSNNS